MAKISITQDHIDRGNVDSCDSCPIALATLEMLVPGCKIQVGLDNCIRILFGGDLWSERMPDEALEFVDAFDGQDDAIDFCDPVPEPFEFEFPLPTHLLRVT